MASDGDMVAEIEALRERVRAAPDDLATRARLGKALLRLGLTAEAAEQYERVAAREPSHRLAHMTIAARRAELEGDAAGREVMAEYFRRHPSSTTLPPGAMLGLPALLRVRGLDRTKLVFLKWGQTGARPNFRGGHFSTKALLPEPGFPIHDFTIVDGNILKPGAVPAHALILNTIAEPDVEGRSLKSLGKYLRKHPKTPVINRPERVAETARDRNFQRLEGLEGVRFPRTVRIAFEAAGPAEVSTRLGEIGFTPPVILREPGTHTSRTTARIDTAADLVAYVGKGLTGTRYAIQYHEIHWREGFFRKLRLFHIDGAFYPVVCHLDRVWNVHGNNRKTVMLADPDLMAEEQRFLADWRAYVGAGAVAALERLAELIGLEFFGVDFTLDDEGRVFVYELNAAMRHSFDHARNFPYKLRYDLATTKAFTAMVDGRLSAAAAGLRRP